MFQFMRNKMLLGAMVGVLAFGMAIGDADARRAGGGRSIGKQSSTVTQRQQAPQPSPAQQAAPQQTPAQPQAAPATQPQRNRWLGPLAGIAAGLGIAALLSHFGLAGAAAQMLANVILIALIAFAVIWLIRRLRGGKPAEPAYASGGAARSAGDEPALRQTSWQAQQDKPSPAAAAAGVAGAAAGSQPWGVPSGFDTEAFLRHAKVNFVRYQAAWDAGNLDDIREFSTPEMFAEIKMDLSERGGAVNRTDVVKLDAELLGIEQDASGYLASVKFSGLLRETEGGAAEPFIEVWNLSKPAAGEGGWVLAGIQQLS